MSSLAVTYRRGQGRGTLLRQMLCSLLAVAACECHASDTQALFSLLPEQTSVAVAVNDFSLAVVTNTDADPGDNPQWWGDFSETFGLAPQELAGATLGGLLRAEIYVAGAWEEIVVARIDSQKLSPLLDAYRQENERAAEPRVHREHLILATAPAAAQVIAERLEAADDQVLLTGWEHISLKDGRDSSETLRLTWYAAPWLKETLLAGEDEDATPSKRLRNAQRHGLTGIASLGGIVDYDNGLPAAARTIVHAPRPWSATLQMFEHLQPQQDLPLPAWVPDDGDHGEVASLDLPQAFEYIDALFDDFYADGIEGTYQETSQDIRTELEVDLEKDVYADMGQQFCLLHNTAADATQRRTLYAFETKMPKTASAAIRKLMQDDPEVTEVAVEGCDEPMWLVPAEKPGGEDFVFMVANGCIFFTNDAKLMHRVLKPEAGHTLAQDKEVQQTFEAILADAGEAPSFFAVRGKGNAAGASQADRPRPPLKLLFAGPKTLDVWSDEQSGDFLSAIFPNGEDFRVSVGFSEENGWRLHSHTLPRQGEEGTNNSRE